MYDLWHGPVFSLYDSNTRASASPLPRPHLFNVAALMLAAKRTTSTRIMRGAKHLPREIASSSISPLTPYRGIHPHVNEDRSSELKSRKDRPMAAGTSNTDGTATTGVELTVCEDVAYTRGTAYHITWRVACCNDHCVARCPPGYCTS